jgi:hypothetical protein
MHIKNFEEASIAWKAFSYNSSTWASYKFNNQLVDFAQNKIMRCIIYDSEMIGFEILTLWVLERVSLFITQVKWHNIHEDETYFPK